MEKDTTPPTNTETPFPSNDQINTILEKYLEKMVILKKNFLTHHYKKTDLSKEPSKNESIISQNEIIRNEEIIEEDEKSVSTDVSIYEIIGNLSKNGFSEKKENFEEAENLQYNVYLRKLGKYFNYVRNFIFKNKVKLNLRYVEYFFELFVSNHVLQQEIHTLFRFFMSLLDFKKKMHFLTEESFSKIFYDVLIRLEIDSIDHVVYQTIETFIFYINMHLKILKIEFNKIEMLEKNIIGYDLLFEIFCNTKNPKVKENSKKCLLNIFKSQLNYRENFAEQITFFYYNTIFENLHDTYNKLTQKNAQNKLKNILNFILSIVDEMQQNGNNKIFYGFGIMDIIDVYVSDHVK